MDRCCVALSYTIHHTYYACVKSEKQTKKGDRKERERDRKITEKSVPKILNRLSYSTGQQN